MPVHINAKLIEKEQLKPDIFKFTISAKEIADIAKAGQFLEIRVSDNIDPFLRRPISIYDINKEKSTVTFIFQVKGKGTNILSNKNIGETIDVLGPLGSGIFNLSDYKSISVIGGGIGIFPLHELAKNAHMKTTVKTYLGFRNKDLVVCEEDFKEVSNKLVITTDDGTYGKNGFAINYLIEDLNNSSTDCIYACGPLPMLRAVQKLALERNIPCQISLEEKMGCGIGACLGCAVKTASSPKNEPQYVHVCKAGPVFDASYVEI